MITSNSKDVRRPRMSISDPSIDLHYLRLGQHDRRPRLDLDRVLRIARRYRRGSLPRNCYGQGKAASGAIAHRENCSNSPTRPRDDRDCASVARRERLVAVNVAPGQRLSAQAAKLRTLAPIIQDHGPRCPIRYVIFPAQHLLDVAAHGRWTLDVHRARIL
jgi:hypothetical protein